MAIVAPRYTPTGTLPSAMPTPQVRAQSGLAEGLAAIGDTIATLGKSAQYVKEKVERDEAIQQSRIEAQTRASETAGTHAALQWRERNEARLAKFYQSRGGNTVNDFATWEKESTADTGDDFKKDLSPEAITAFDRQVSLWRQDFHTKASTHAANQHREFTVLTNNKAQQVAMDAAALSFAKPGGDIEAMRYVAEATAKAETRRNLTGEPPTSAEELAGAARFRALELLARENEDAAIVRYNGWAEKGEFGPFADNAKKFIAPTMREVNIRNEAKAIAVIATKDGIYDTNVALEAAEKRGADDGRPAEDMQKLRETLERIGAADLRRRNKLADDTLSRLEIWQSEPSLSLGSVRDPKAFLALPGVAEALSQATPEKRHAIETRMRLGPEHSDPTDKATLDNILAKSDPQEMMGVTRWDYIVSQRDWESFDKARRMTDKPMDKKIYDALVEMRNSDRTIAPLPRATAEKKLSPDQLAEVEEFNAQAAWVVNYMKQPEQREALNKDPSLFTYLLQKAKAEAARPITITVDGEEVETTIAGENKFPLGFPVTQELMDAAGVNSMADPNARALVLRAYLDRQEAERIRQNEIDLNARLRAYGRPVTNEEMKANRERIGTRENMRLEARIAKYAQDQGMLTTIMLDAGRVVGRADKAIEDWYRSLGVR